MSFRSLALIDTKVKNLIGLPKTLDKLDFGGVTLADLP
jgi:hypothetical protein